MAAALGVLTWSALGLVIAPRQSRPAPASSVLARDPRLIVQPRSVTRMAEVDGLRLALTVQPVLPGPNRVVIVLADHGRTTDGVQVDAAATMPGMPMRPARLSVHEESNGRFVGVGTLAMFGRWQIAVHVARRHATPLVHVFAVSLDLPPALLDAVAAARAHAGQ